MSSIRSFRARPCAHLVACILGALLAVSCGRHSGAPISSAPRAQQQSAAAPSSAPAASTGNPPTADLFDLKAHPDALVLHARKADSLTESERNFGVAPKRSPEVEYEPDVILMEQGDRAIRSIASDGLRWTFDAHAPQVSDFALGKIVFATGRAVGRVAALEREGDDVRVILAPVQITDVIRNGSFAMNEDVDFGAMVMHVAPDFPQPPDEPQKAGAALDPRPGAPVAGWDGPRDQADGTFLPVGVILPGASGTAIPNLPADIAPIAPASQNIPTLEIQNVRVKPIASNSGIGVQCYYNKDGVSVYAGSVVTLTGSRLGFFLKIVNAHIVNAGIQIAAASSVKLAMDGRAMQEFKINFKKKLWVPVDFSIPLGGPVPFAINFDTGFDIGTGFSANTSTLRAEGDYAFSGGVWAGYLNGKWGASIPREVRPNYDLGKTVEGVSVGITSLVMGADVRATAGLGAFGFTTGVFGNIRFAGTLLRSSDVGYAPRCRQGTIVANFDAGVGYSIPGWAADAVNTFLSFVTDFRIERVGAFLQQKPPVTLFHGTTQVPGNCATPTAALSSPSSLGVG